MGCCNDQYLNYNGCDNGQDVVALSPELVKEWYEYNPNTNAFTNKEKAALHVIMKQGLIDRTQDGIDGIDGVNGRNGIDGIDGVDGKDGLNGAKGDDGLSAYELAISNGYEGSEEEWLESAVGTPGKDGKDGKDGSDGEDGTRGPRGPKGEPGKDADGSTPVDSYTKAEADKKFVDVAGDMMTGTLMVNTGDAASAMVHGQVIGFKATVGGKKYGMTYDKANKALDFKLDNDTALTLVKGKAPTTKYAPVEVNDLVRKDYVDGLLGGDTTPVDGYTKEEADDLFLSTKTDGTLHGNITVKNGTTSDALLHSDILGFLDKSDSKKYGMVYDHHNKELDFKVDNVTSLSLKEGKAPTTPHEPVETNDLVRKDYVDQLIADLQAQITALSAGKKG